jgi:hypothetical protein
MCRIWPPKSDMFSKVEAVHPSCARLDFKRPSKASVCVKHLVVKAMMEMQTALKNLRIGRLTSE